MIYAFKCSKCGHEFDLDLDSPSRFVDCPECKELAIRVYQVNVKKHKEQE